MKFWLIIFFLAAQSLMAKGTKADAIQNETVVLAAGCFWGTEEYFRKIPGVISTRVGYMGGSKKDPSYEDVTTGKTGHAESAEIKFDPKVISLEDLLIKFFKMHDPTTLNRQGNDKGTQYRSAIFTTSDAQMKMAMKVKERVEKSKAWKDPIMTEIKPAEKFYEAEDYHQKYLIQNPGGYDNHYERKLNF